MLECFKSKSGGSVYYYNGKRISKKEAQEIGKKLPSCIAKTSKNEISSLKRRIKEIMSSGENVNKELNQRLEQERRDRIVIEETLHNLTEQCSDRPDLIRTIDDLKDQVSKLEISNNETKKDLEDTKQINMDMKVSIDDLLESIRGYQEREKIMESMNKQIDYQNIKIQEYENRLLQQEEEFRSELEGEKEQCKIANDSLDRKVQAMAELAKTLKNSLEQEKDKCLLDVQKAIDEEREISKREAREYENRISDLNSRILIAEQSLEDLNKIGKIQTTSEIPVAKKKLSKVSKKLKKASK